ncbi:hypothetical protein [Afipia sp. Root123D2]|uniref:hypothetical protein n=1 Tax=Afipia sp. Root123D2 TaxID=1736436 RepID=UPI000B22A327|nr:hypothetical protein [Afipia sp. Root123D2]
MLPRQRQHILERLTEVEAEFITADWSLFAQPHQIPPSLTAHGERWLTWLLIGGRGAGKTRAGAEWIRAQALGLPPLADEAVGNIALVGKLTLECAALCTVLVHELWTGDIKTIDTMASSATLLVTYWGFRFGVLGVYFSGRTREKVCRATGQDAPGLVDRLVKAVVTKK